MISLWPQDEAIFYPKEHLGMPGTGFPYRGRAFSSSHIQESQFWEKRHLQSFVNKLGFSAPRHEPLQTTIIGIVAESAPETVATPCPF
jgi:hypothetical protein